MGLLFHMSMAIKVDVTHSKRSPGIGKANKLTYRVSAGTWKGRMGLVIIKLEPIPVACLAGV